MSLNSFAFVDAHDQESHFTTTSMGSLNMDILDKSLGEETEFEGIIGHCSTLQHVVELIKTVAPSDSTVLLLGETGTGKELIARAIHNCSRRKNRMLVKLNCAAVPQSLIASELFGRRWYRVGMFPSWRWR